MALNVNWFFALNSTFTLIFSPWNWKNQLFYGQKFLKLDTLKLLWNSLNPTNWPQNCLKLKLTHVALNLGWFFGKQFGFRNIFSLCNKKSSFFHQRDFVHMHATMHACKFLFLAPPLPFGQMRSSTSWYLHLLPPFLPSFLPFFLSSFLRQKVENICQYWC